MKREGNRGTRSGPVRSRRVALSPPEAVEELNLRLAVAERETLAGRGSRQEDKVEPKVLQTLEGGK